MASNYTAVAKVVSIQNLERATRFVLSAASGGPSTDQVGGARELLRRTDLQLDAGTLAELDAWVIEIVRDELSEALNEFVEPSPKTVASSRPGDRLHSVVLA